jgi:hypothetical protein
VELVYKKLDGVLSKEAVEKIKELGGPENVDWEPILPKLPFATRRFVEATLVENERLREQRSSALEEAKKNAEVFARERVEREVSEVTATANELLKSVSWSSDKAHASKVALLKDFLADRSPAKFAELAVGTVIAHKLHEDVKALKTSETTLKAQVETLTKERDKALADLKAIREAENPRRRREVSVAPVSVPPTTYDSGAEALDALAKEVMAGQQ